MDNFNFRIASYVLLAFIIGVSLLASYLNNKK